MSDLILEKETERLDDLLYNGLKLIQDASGFCFGCDAVELAAFVNTGRGSRVCDLGAGNGIISVLLAKKRDAKVTAVEIQESAARLCARNAVLNGLSDKIETVNADMLEFCTPKNKGAFDTVVANPPYCAPSSGSAALSESEAIARHEIKISLDGVLSAAAHLLKFGGHFFMVHKAERLAEVIALASSKKLEPKVLQILKPAAKKPPHLFLLECIAGGKAGIKVLPERQVNLIV